MKHRCRWSGFIELVVHIDIRKPEDCCSYVLFMQVGHSQAVGPGRVRRDSAARAMQGWHSQRVPSNGDVGDQIIKVC